MTEYEIAALAMAKAELALAKAVAEEEAIRDMIGIMQDSAALLLESSALFVSIFSGYLAIVYFLGTKLTNVQAVAVSFFYVLMALSNRFNFYVINNSFREIQHKFATLTGKDVIDGIPELSLIVTAFMVLASLFYMWTERRKK